MYVDRLIAAWTNLDTAIQTAIISGGITLLAAGIGFAVVTYQVAHQARTAMKQRVYEQIIQICEQASDAEIEFSNFIRHLLLELETYDASKKKPQDFRRMSSRVPRMLELQKQQADMLIASIRIIERWLIIDPRIKIFQLAFNASFHEIYSSLFRDFLQIVYEKMPIEISDNRDGCILHSPKDCTAKELGKIKLVGEELISKLGNFTAYLHDFQVEMQNLLLRGLFKYRVPKRKPIDPNSIILSVDKHAELTKRLYEETEGGRYLKQAEDKEREKFTAKT